MPPMNFGAPTPGSALDQNAAGSPADGRGDESAQVMGKIRDLGQALSELGQMIPAGAQEMQQMQQILKRLIVKVAQRGPQQTPSASQVPGA